MCKFCSRFKKQLLFLRETIRLHVERGKDTELSTKLPPEARERIRKSIQNNSFKPKKGFIKLFLQLFLFK